MNERDFGYATDIKLACGDIRNFSEGKNLADLFNDQLFQAAILRKLEIIGEVVKRLSPEFTASHTTIPWRQWAGLRDRLIHAYDDVDLDIVWSAVSNDVPKLLASIETYLGQNQ